MGVPLRVLIVEDSVDDTELILRQLRRADYEPVSERVQTAEEMKMALEREAWELVVSDYTMPQFAAPTALSLLNQSGRDVPFIVVSGSIGEDIAVTMMKTGAHDYILKQNLTRFIPAVQRELREAENRRQQRLAEQAKQRLQVERAELLERLQQENEDLAALTRVTANAISTLDLDELLRVLLDRVVEVMRADAATILLAEGAELRVRASAGAVELSDSADVIHVGEGFAGSVASRKEPVYVEDAALDPLVTDPLIRERGIRSLLGVPLKRNGQLIGVLHVDWLTVRPCRDREVHLLEITAERCAAAIQNAQLYEETKRIATALTESEWIRRLVLDNVDEIAYMVEVGMDSMFSGRVRFVSGRVEAILGYQPEEFIRDPELWFGIIHPDDAPALAETTQAIFASGRAGLREYRVRHKRTGDYRWMEDHVVPQLDAAGRVVSQFGVARDITERKQAEGQMLRAQRLESLGTLAGGVAHDLNNALAPILMASQLLRLEFPDHGVRYLELIESGAKRAAAMVKQLLTFAKGAEGDRLLIQPRHLLEEMTKLIEGSFPKHIQLKSRSERNLRSIQGDATQLHQVLLNLCVNARDAMPTGGTLTLKAQNIEIDTIFASAVPEAKPGPYVLVQVMDTGRGIPPEILGRIFEPFFTTKAPDQGTGLGLSTLLGIVRSHGGFVRVDSVPGQGSTFAVYLPAYGSGAGDVSLPTPAETTIRGHGETVLVVDDEAAIREVMRTVLTALNFKVITASDGCDALFQVVERRTDLRAVITDLHMPHMDGLSFARVVKARSPQIGIIIVSGRMDEREEHEFKALGVNALLEKPFTQEKLVEALETIFQK